MIRPKLEILIEMSLAVEQLHNDCKLFGGVMSKSMASTAKRLQRLIEELEDVL